MRTILAMAINLGSFEFTNDPRLSEYFGMDFMMDTNLHIWLLELNRKPQMVNYTKDRAESYSKFMLDFLQIQSLYVKSRLER